MKFLGDIPIARATIEHLRAAGHDCIRVIDRLPPTAEDEEIIRVAAAEQRVILCFDLGFAARLAVSGLVFPSIVTFRLAREGAAQINRRLDEVLPGLASELPKGVLATVEDSRVRVRPLPVFRVGR